MNDNAPVLLVEDDEVDVMTVRRALRDLAVTNPLHLAGDGEEALHVLRDDGLLPGLILLDINMPRMNGIEFLREIKADPTLKRIPVVVLTTSKEESDRFEAFGLSVAGYMIKPADYQQFVELMRTINLYWTTCEAIPR